jgi:hypothetical protein
MLSLRAAGERGFDVTIEITASTISVIVAPVVILSCSVLFLNGLLQRYQSLGIAVRTLNRERLDLLRVGGKNTIKEQADTVLAERLHTIEMQLPSMLGRHNLIHMAVLTVDGANLVFVASTFVFAIANVTGSLFISLVALFGFLLGMCLMLAGVVIMTIEASQSKRELTYEIQQSLSMGAQFIGS